MIKKTQKTRILLFIGALILQLRFLPLVVEWEQTEVYHFWWGFSFFLLLALLYRPLSKRFQPPPDIKRRALILLGTILVLAAALRLYQIHTLPPGLWVDELYTASNALELKTDYLLKSAYNWKNPLFMTPLVGEGWVETSNLYLYYVRFTWLFFGFNYIGMKMVSILPGIGAVLLVFFLVKRLWGLRAALAAAFFLAVSSWQIALSRWGWDEVLLTALQIPVFIYLWRGFRKRRLFDFALAGLFLGLCLYSYAASRILAAFAIFYLLLECAISRRFFRKNAAGLGLFLLFFLLVSLPLGIYFVKNPSAFSSRLTQLSVWNEIRKQDSLSPLVKNIYRHFLMFHFIGDPNIRHHVSKTPLLDIVSGIFLLFGLFTTVRGIGKPKNRFLLLWLLFGLLGGILSASHEAPQAYRTGISAVPVFILCGIGLSWLFRRGKRYLRRTGRKTLSLYLATALLLLLALSVNINRYFVKYPKDPELWEKFFGAEQTFLARSARGPSDILLDGAYASYNYFTHRVAMKIINKKIRGYFDPVKREPLPSVEGFQVLIPPFRKIAYEYYLPSLELKPVKNPSGTASFYRATVTSQVLETCPILPPEKRSPFEIRWFGEDGFIKKEYKQTLNDLDTPVGATWATVQTNFLMPRDYHALFWLETNGRERILFDEKRAPPNEKGKIFIPLSRGQHPLRIDVEIVKSPLELNLYWRPDFEYDEIVPAAFFLPPGK